MKDKRIKSVKNWPESKSVHDIQVFLGFANFYQCFIQGFNKIAKPVTLILRTLSSINLLTILQSLINTVEEDEVCGDKSGCNQTNLSNPFMSKRSIRAGHLILGGAKKSGNNPKRDDENSKKGAKPIKALIT